LQQLRARAAPAASVELDAIAAKAAVPADWQRRSGRTTIDDVRTDAWLAICRLAGATMSNEAARKANEYDKLKDVDQLWALAIDRTHEWMRETE
jgi:hypothetical protein